MQLSADVSRPSERYIEIVHIRKHADCFSQIIMLYRRRQRSLAPVAPHHAANILSHATAADFLESVVVFCCYRAMLFESDVAY